MQRASIDCDVHRLTLLCLGSRPETRELDADKGDVEGDIGVSAPEGKTVLVARFGARSKAKVGEEVEVAVDTRALHFFDPETGLGIYDGKEKGAGA